MTDSLRDEVREQLRSILTEVAQGGAKVLADPGVFDCAVKGGEIEITNLVLGGKELEWHKEGPRWCATPVLDNAVRYVVRKQCSTSWEPYVNGVRLEMGLTYPTLEAAKAACQADFTKRIQSALTANPAPVVSDDAVERAVDVFEREVAKEQDYNPLHAGITNAVIMHKVLAAALSQGEG